MNEYGLLLRTENRYGMEYLVAEVVRREDDHNAPRNCSEGIGGDERPKGYERFQFNGLALKGFVSSGDKPELIGFEPSYYDVYAVRKNDAKRMAFTLETIDKRIAKDSAYLAVDCFVSVCAALKLSFVVEVRGESRGSSYDDNAWWFMTIAEGRNRFRAMAESMIQRNAA